MPRNETAELYVKYVFKFFKKIAKLFSKWLTFYISSVPVSLQTFITIFYVSYPKRCVVNLTVIITWISLKASNTEYLIMSFLLFSLVKYPFIFLVHFLTAFYCYESSLYILDESFVRYLLHKYFPVCSLSCHPNKTLHRAKVFNFDDIQFTIFFLLWIILLMWSMDFYQTLHPKAISPMLSSKVLQVYILYLTDDLSWVYFCDVEFWDAFFFFFLPQFTEKMVLPRVNCFCTPVEYKLAILACGYFWFLYSVLLICVYTLSLATSVWLLYLDNNSWNWPVIPPILFFHSIVLGNP